MLQGSELTHMCKIAQESCGKVHGHECVRYLVATLPPKRSSPGAKPSIRKIFSRVFLRVWTTGLLSLDR